MADLDEKARRAAAEWLAMYDNDHYPLTADCLATAFKAFAEEAQRCDCGRDLGRGLCSVCDNDE